MVSRDAAVEAGAVALLAVDIETLEALEEAFLAAEARVEAIAQ